MKKKNTQRQIQIRRESKTIYAIHKINLHTILSFSLSLSSRFESCNCRGWWYKYIYIERVCTCVRIERAADSNLRTHTKIVREREKRWKKTSPTLIVAAAAATTLTHYSVALSLFFSFSQFDIFMCMSVSRSLVRSQSEKKKKRERTYERTKSNSTNVKWSISTLRSTLGWKITIADQSCVVFFFLSSASGQWFYEPFSRIKIKIHILVSEWIYVNCAIGRKRKMQKKKMIRKQKLKSK